MFSSCSSWIVIFSSKVEKVVLVVILGRFSCCIRILIVLGSCFNEGCCVLLVLGIGWCIWLIIIK